MKIKNVKDSLVKSKRGFALGMAILIGGMAVIPTLREIIYAEDEISVGDIIGAPEYGVSDPLDYYGKNQPRYRS